MIMITEWIKKNWLSVLLVSIIVVLLMRNGANVYRNASISSDRGFAGLDGAAEPMLSKSMIAPESGFVPEAAPVAQTERMVVQDTDVSLLVKDVAGVIKTIEKTAESMGGYMVNKSLNQPEGAATGYITIRVPAEKRETALEEIRKTGVKVVSENVYGHDVTDQFVDLSERISQMEKTKAKIQAIMDQATRVSDLIDIQNQLNNVQRQIDNYKGQQKYLEQTAKLTRITVNLSTDELALPYTPDKAWRPEAVFKAAVRSLVGLLRSVAGGLIWIAVFAPALAVLVAVAWVIRRLARGRR